MCVPKYKYVPIVVESVELECENEFHVRKNIYFDLSDHVVCIRSEIEVFRRYIKSNKSCVEEFHVLMNHTDIQNEHIAVLINLLEKAKHHCDPEEIKRKFSRSERRKARQIISNIFHEWNTWQQRLAILNQNIRNIQTYIVELEKRLIKVKSKSYRGYKKFLKTTLRFPYFSRKQRQILKTFIK